MHCSVPSSPELNQNPADGVSETPGVKVMVSRLWPLVQTVSACGPPDAPPAGTAISPPPTITGNSSQTKRARISPPSVFDSDVNIYFLGADVNP